jgi:hypothetical protein
MILQQHASGTLAIRQVDHAAFAAFLLEHWSDHNFPNNPQREQIILATREHDCGWQELDSNPRLDASTGMPVDFLHATPEESQGIWRRGAAEWVDRDPFVALLIVQHGYALNESSHRGSPVWKPFFTELAQLRAELRTRLGLTQNHVESAYSFLRMADWFSLACCMSTTIGMEKPEKYGGYQFRRDGERVLFRPYPFDERELSFDLPVHPLREGGYRSSSAAARAFERTDQQQITLNQLERFDK